MFLTAATVIALSSGSALAASGGNQSEDYLTLKKEMEIMRAEMAEMRALLKVQGAMLKEKSVPEITKAEVKELKKEVKKIAKKADDASEWRDSNSAVHLAGYASAGYSDRQNTNGSFDTAKFAPIFHYQWKDLVLLETELEFSLQDDGSTEVGMEYLTIDVLFNDYAALVAGKFISPLGQFRQNVHPSWINKLPSAPSGFGHDGAAPIADVGAQVRGGVPIGDKRLNYALYIGNGPELVSSGGEITAVETLGVARDQDGEKVYGGRVGFLPIPSLEIGLSGATGKVGISGEADRDYGVYGADFNYNAKKFQIRGEYIAQEVGASATSSAPDSAKWAAYYLQGAYKLPYNLEAVVRYGDFDTPEAEESQTQWVTGMNYLFAPQLMGKVAYEFNDGRTGTTADGNRFLAQIAYGF